MPSILYVIVAGFVGSVVVVLGLVLWRVDDPETGEPTSEYEIVEAEQITADYDGQGCDHGGY
jgi:ABC-type transporter Mla subunit MlaD